MSEGWLIALVIAVFVTCIACITKAFKMLNTPDGERYLKMRMQGPFVPLEKEETPEDGVSQGQDHP